MDGAGGWGAECGAGDGDVTAFNSRVLIGHALVPAIRARSEGATVQFISTALRLFCGGPASVQGDQPATSKVEVTEPGTGID